MPRSKVYTRERVFRPFDMRRTMLDALWRSAGLGHSDAPFTVLPDSLTALRGRKAGPMMWRRIQRILRDVVDGKATFGL